MIAISFSLLFGSGRSVRSFHTGVRGGNGSSMGYVNPDLAAIIAGVSLLVLAYIVYRVWRSLKNDRKAGRSGQQEEADAFRELYEDNFKNDDRE